MQDRLTWSFSLQNLFWDYEGRKSKCHIPEEKLSHDAAKPEFVDQNRAIDMARDPKIEKRIPRAST